jgi:geranylgeranyl pyrophosphate synthase
VILIGDFLFAQSAILAAATESTRVVAIFASTLASICDGQLREMLGAHNLQQNRQEYLDRIFGKTASLFAGAAEMGAVLGGASEPQIQQLRGFGNDLGMAFQIIDDVLDLREKSSDLGKPAGNDIRQGVVTLPTMMYASRLEAGSREMDVLAGVIAGEEESNDEILEVVLEIRRSGALDEASEIANGYLDSARTCLNVVEEPQTREWLEELLDLAVQRTA